MQLNLSSTGSPHTSASGATSGPHAVGGALVLNGLTKRYGAAHVLKGVDLSIERGSFVTILGPSGSGKTTLLRLLSGYLSPDEGSIVLDGQDISSWTPARRGIGMVFQNYALFPHMSAARNIDYPLRVRKWSRQRRAERVQQILRLVDLEEFSESMPRALSGGQQQRVALGRALAFDPTLLLMDEPLGALDKELRLRMVVELRRIHEQVGSTFLYVTHDREEALSLSDRIVILRGGRIVADGSPQELFARPRSAFVASFFGGHNLVPCRPLSGGDAEQEWSASSVLCLGTEAQAFSHGPVDQHSNMCIPGDAISLRPSATAGVAVPGLVRSATYMGGRIEAVCVVPGSGTEADVELRVDVPGTDPAPPKAGAHVDLYVDWRRATIVSAADGDHPTPTRSAGDEPINLRERTNDV